MEHHVRRNTPRMLGFIVAHVQQRDAAVDGVPPRAPLARRQYRHGAVVAYFLFSRHFPL